MPDEVLRVSCEVDYALLAWPSSSEASSDDGGFGNRLYQDYRGVTWAEAKRMLLLERELLANPLEDEGDEDAEEARAESLSYLDLGVASAVFALSAARCVPITSCNGSPGHHEAYPLVAFFCRRARVADIMAAAELVGCGLHNADNGALVLYSDEATNLVSFAEELIKRRYSLAPLRRPRSSTSMKRRATDPQSLQMAFPFASGT